MKAIIRNALIDNFYLIVVFTYFTAMLLNTPIGVLRFVWPALIIFNIRAFTTKIAGFKLIIYIYILLNLFSIVNYSTNYLSINVFVLEVITSILPIAFFFIGSNPAYTKQSFYNRALIAIAFLNIVGLYLYIAMPEWYVNWQVNLLFDTIPNLSFDSYTEYGRFASFMTSYYTSNLSVVALIIAMYYIYDRGAKWYILLYVILLSISILLAQHRVSLVFAIIFILLFHVYGLIRLKSASFIFLIITIMIVLIFPFFLVGRFGEMVALGVERFNNLNSVFSSRSDTWINAFENQTNFLFGHGLGSGGHRAFFAGNKSAVLDGNYFKIIYENGFFGLIIFFIIIIVTLFKGVKEFKLFKVEITVIIYFLISAIGANVFNISYIAVMFWFCIGRIWNNKLYDNSK